MKRRALFVITSDPRKSHRPAEAIRIAAGVGVWKKVEVLVYLHEAAVLALSEYPDDLVDEENYTRYLPMLRESERPIYVQRGSPLLAQVGEPSLLFEEISGTQLGELAAQSSSVLHF